MFEHAWDVSIPEATEIQKRLASSLSYERLTEAPRTIAGADISFARFSDDFYAVVVVLSYPELQVVDRAFHRMRVTFPYVPGYLSFREVPAIVEAYKKLRVSPDVVMMDGHGSAHPRRLGVAAHLGPMLDTPTIGCAKSLLFGTGEAPGGEAGSVSHLADPKTGEVIGAYLRTKRDVKPVIISPGHRMTLFDALKITKACVRRHCIPEPTRQAHELVNAFRRGEIGA